MNKCTIGKVGEKRIVSFLKSKGFFILESNFRYGKKEVDIIARKDDKIIFIEVKTRNYRGFGTGAEAIDTRKRNNIISVARYYVNKNKLNDCNIRFDVASIDKNNVIYIENAFQV